MSQAEDTKTRYCIFDVLGTLFPWKESFRFLELLSQHNLEPKLPRAKLEGLLRERIDLIFSSGERGLQEFIRDAYSLSGADEAAIAVKVFEERLLREAEIHPEADSILRQLSGEYTLLVCSDTTGATKRMVRRAGIKRYFAKEFYSHELHLTKSKEFFRLVVKSFPGSMPSQFISIGDNLKSDIAYPQGVGMKTIWVRNEALGLYDVEPDFIVEDLAEVVEAIKRA